MIYAICNPIAGNGRSKKIGLQIKQILDDKGLPCRLLLTESPGHATFLAGAARQAGASMVLSIGGEPMERAQTVVAGRLARGPWRSFLRAVGCGLIIDISVWLYRSSKSLVPVLFGVPLFIVCGFYHSIADVVYLVGAWTWSPAILWYYPVIVIGNYVGCNVRRIVLPKES